MPTSSTPPSSNSPWWVAAAGRRIAPSYSGGSRSNLIRFRLIRMHEAIRLVGSGIAPLVRYFGISLTLGNNSASADS